jgi:hypothetical protein
MTNEELEVEILRLKADILEFTLQVKRLQTPQQFPIYHPVVPSYEHFRAPWVVTCSTETTYK